MMRILFSTLFLALLFLGCTNESDVSVVCPSADKVDCEHLYTTIDSLEYELCCVRALDTERRGQIQRFYNWFHEQGIKVPEKCNGRNVDLTECGKMRCFDEGQMDGE